MNFLFLLLNKSHLNKIQSIIEQYSNLGPIPGILFPLLESFFPFLPLLVIVAGNGAAFGLWLGFLYSWIGVTLGGFLVFLLARKYGVRAKNYIVKKFPQAHSIVDLLQTKGFTVLFLLSLFPFTPSVVVNVVSGAVGVPSATYLTAVILGKALMIFSMAYIGYDYLDILKNPIQIVAIFIIVFVLWFVGKKIEKRMIKKNEGAVR